MSGNGADVTAVYQLLGTVASSLNEFRAETRRDVAELRRDVSGLKRDVASLRQTVAEYHASVLGHGVLISELDERPRRVEEHLRLPPAA